MTSNPSPGYLYRVTAVFNDNGQGVRGDLKAVVRAILMDYDARGSAKTGQGVGHQREPVIRLTNLLRAFNASSPSRQVFGPQRQYELGPGSDAFAHGLQFFHA